MKETNETAAPPAAGRESLRRTVEEGYRRLAFGPVGDAVRLMLAEEGDWVDYPHLDLFNVAELRRGKGTMEMKFVSRLEALESGGLESFCAALGQGARALYQGKEGEADAPAPE